MNRSAQWLALLAVSAALLFSTGCQKLKARDQLNKGVQAYKAAKYEKAIEHFKQAAELDPGLNVARLYLATAYAQQFIPGVESDENNRMAEQAIEKYKDVLEHNPSPEHKVTALKGIASLYFNMKDFEEAKKWHRRVLEADPQDPETYYSIGVIDWTQTYQTAAELKAPEGLKVDDSIIKNKKLCAELREKNEERVTEGLQMLDKALQYRPDYDDAMAYMNLLYRRRADIQCGDEEARQADLKTADEWVDKTMATKKAKAEAAAKAHGGGIVMEETQ